jgi:hypothetical protein
MSDTAGVVVLVGRIMFAFFFGRWPASVISREIR